MSGAYDLKPLAQTTNTPSPAQEQLRHMLLVGPLGLPETVQSPTLMLMYPLLSKLGKLEKEAGGLATDQLEHPINVVMRNNKAEGCATRTEPVSVTPGQSCLLVIIIISVCPAAGGGHPALSQLALAQNLLGDCCLGLAERTSGSAACNGNGTGLGQHQAAVLVA